MTKYIDTEKLETEVERRRTQAEKNYKESTYSMGRCDAFAEIRNFIHPLQQEQPDVDLEKEIDAIWNPRFDLGWDEKSLLSMNHEGFASVARHFYELGVKAGKEQNQEEQQECGHFVSEYVSGKKPKWNIGDVLAYYICTSNEEGERIIGKIANVEFDEEAGWIYTFEDEGASDEESLVEEGAYKKN